ncbi:MAG: acyl-CoA dehydrogenase [Gammaproteobacteria bacterium]|nr:acyl-CoA dehydrogenase [Gammaproteobacteria bacterium]
MTDQHSNNEEIIEQRRMLKEAAEAFSEGSLTINRVRELRNTQPGYSKAIWQEMVELGWMGIPFSEELGGLNLNMSELAIVIEELGQHAAPEPMIDAIVAAAGCINYCDHEELKKKLVGQIIEGQLIPALAWQEAHTILDVSATQTSASNADETTTLSGQKCHVAMAKGADGFVVSANSPDGLALYWVDANARGISLDEHLMADDSFSYTLTFNEAPATRLSAAADGTAALQQALDEANVMTAAYLTGVCKKTLQITLDYLNTRVQFGKKIGSFQALQHRAVDLYIQQELAQAALADALTVLENTPTPAERSIAASRAKSRCAEAAKLITQQAIQLHGGIGYTDECDVGLFVNRTLVVAPQYGNALAHRRRFATLSPSKTNSDDVLAGRAVPETSEGQDLNALNDDDFRLIVRDFFEKNYPDGLRNPPSRLRWTEIKDWYMTLSRKGWVAPAWPREYGGMGLGPAKMLIYIEEQERYGIARAPDMGITMVGPLLIQHGNEEQRAKYLPKILAGEHIWCQGYSEPNAGSDLASLRTEAIDNGDHFIVNGQKTWTTLAQDANHIFLLVRTNKDGKKQEGISFLLVDFDQPGITVRPIRNIAGHEEFCEVFLDNVRVPKENLVGELNKGWTIAKALLSFERIFLGSPKQSQYALQRLQVFAAANQLFDDPGFHDKFTALRLDVADLEAAYSKFADIVKRGETLGPDVSLLKIWGTETFSRLTELAIEAAGSAGGIKGGHPAGSEKVDILSNFYNARPATIYGGSNEIQRNILSKAVLGLPG